MKFNYLDKILALKNNYIIKLNKLYRFYYNE